MDLDWLDHLNPAQRQAVTASTGPLLIVAGPGSGKTRVIVHRIAYLLGAENVDPYNLLAVTFTNKAAREMKERLEALVGGRRAQLLTVGTFHATCARWLRIDGERLGIDRRFAILDDADQISTMKGILADLEVDEKRFSPRGVLSRISAAKSELISPERYASRARDGESTQDLMANVVQRAYPRYQQRLTELHALDFDDLLGKAVELLRECPDVLERYQERYRYIMVDEFQDTNVSQYQLIKLLAQKYRNVCVVGDEDQSIYGWRKADVRNLAHFERDFPELGVIMLEQNYRSTQTILDVASAVITPNLGRKPKRLWTDNPRGTRVVLHEAYNAHDEALFVVRQIEQLRRAGASYRDVAVTYRTNVQSRVLEETFVRYGLRYRIVGGTRFYERREVKDLVAYLRLVANPADNLSFQRIVNVPARGVGKRTVSDLVGVAARLGVAYYDAARMAANDDTEVGADGRIRPVVALATRQRSQLADFVATIAEARQMIQTQPPSSVLDFLLNRVRYRDSLIDGTEAGDERWGNVVQLQEKLHTFDGVEPGDGLSQFLEDAALEPDVESTDPATPDLITLITLHAAKGLEFPHVFIVGLEEGLSPHSRSMQSMEQLAEERRLLYVGVTRAMQKLFLVHASRRTMNGMEEESVRSRFLEDLPVQLLDVSFSGAAARPALASRAGRLAESGRDSWPPPPPRDAWPPTPSRPARPSEPRGAPVRPRSQLGFTFDVDRPPDMPSFAPADPGTPPRDGQGQRPASPPPLPGSGEGSDVNVAAGRAILGKLTGAPVRRDPTFKSRDRVRHAEYGEGDVLASSFAGREELVLVRFDMRPEKPKNLSLAIHRLERA